MSERTLSPPAIDYPSGDGEPLAENDWQLRAILGSFASLDLHFRDRPDVYVSGDLFIYYEEGNPRARVAPDVFVVFGVPKRNRPIYKLWEEGVVPAFVMEVASRGTWREDEGRKARLYERLGVREYWQYDPTGEYLGLNLKGRRLVDGAYEPQPVVEYLDGTVLLRSETLRLDLHVNGEEMYFSNPETGERVFNPLQPDAAVEASAAAEARFKAAEARYEAAAEAAAAAEARFEATAEAAAAAEARFEATAEAAAAAEARFEAATEATAAAEARFETATEATAAAEARFEAAAARAETIGSQFEAAVEAERTRAETERARAETERARAEAERAQAEAERARAETAEARVAELEALLREKRG